MNLNKIFDRARIHQGLRSQVSDLLPVAVSCEMPPACFTLQRFNAIQCNSIQFNTIQCNSIQFNVIPCNSMQFNAMQNYAIKYLQLTNSTVCIVQSISKKSGANIQTMRQCNIKCSQQYQYKMMCFALASVNTQTMQGGGANNQTMRPL